MYDEAAGHFAAMLFLQRMRTPNDRAFISQTFTDLWGRPPPSLDEQAVTVTPECLSIGWASLMRSSEGDLRGPQPFRIFLLAAGNPHLPLISNRTQCNTHDCYYAPDMWLNASVDRHLHVSRTPCS